MLSEDQTARRPEGQSIPDGKCTDISDGSTTTAVFIINDELPIKPLKGSLFLPMTHSQTQLERRDFSPTQHQRDPEESRVAEIKRGGGGFFSCLCRAYQTSAVRAVGMATHASGSRSFNKLMFDSLQPKDQPSGPEKWL